MNHNRLVFGCAALLALNASAAAIPVQPDPLARGIFKQLIEINTSHSVGDTTAAAQAMAQRLRDAGFSEADTPVLTGRNLKRGNLVARLHGSGAHKPLLIIGHLDVVEARREDWSTDPFVFTEKDGFAYGRGTQDMKDGDAIAVATLIRMKQEGYVPDRDIILALTADEEGGIDNGVDWLLKNHHELVDAEFVLNADSGGIDSDAGKPVTMNLSATEKLYADFEVTATNAGGHSSLPRKDNAIYDLSAALLRLEKHPFPFELNPVTRAWLEYMQGVEKGQRAKDIKAILGSKPDPAAIARLSQDIRYNSTLHTTCVATMLHGGHAPNALPQRAGANVNCRILPGHSPEEMRQELVKIFADPRLTVQWRDTTDDSLHDTGSSAKALKPPPPREELMTALKGVTTQMWPGLPIVPKMETGASDCIYTAAAGIPCYGLSGTAIDRDDDRAHGKDERLRLVSFDEGTEFYYRFMKTLTGGK